MELGDWLLEIIVVKEATPEVTEEIKLVPPESIVVRLDWVMAVVETEEKEEN